ncbi:2'-5' RNA ligase family protein [Streptosporangium saharense]|uniref:2'-5' RNA ligase family protein n=1 Tax=Streptosporangium saharense TaxID=1706840 RepID=UPI003444C2EE
MWHFPVENQPALHVFAQWIRPALRAVRVLDPVPSQWLHLTAQGVGFADEVSQEDLTAIGAEVAGRLAGFGPITTRLGPLTVDAGGVHLPADPAAELVRARAAIRAGIGQVWGADRVPEAEQGFCPQVSLAYANANANANADGEPVGPIRQALDGYRESIPVIFDRVSLIDLDQDEGQYRWRIVTTLKLGA